MITKAAFIWSKVQQNQQYCETFLNNSFLFCNVIYSCDGKADFSASLLQSSVSHDPSEISLICWFAAQETFLIIINSYMNGKYKSTFIWNRIFYNILNVFFTDTFFGQFNVSLLNKSTDFFKTKKNLLTPEL